MRGAVTYETLCDVLNHVRASGWQADLVALTGDLVQDDSEAAYDHVFELVSALSIPAIALPGNHDNPVTMQAKFSVAPFQYCGSVKLGNWEVMAVDSYLPGSAAGLVSDEELSQLRRKLAATAAEHVLVCLHHPPVPVDSEWLESVGLRNRDAFMQVTEASGKVRAIAFGHIHQPVDTLAGGMRVLGTPSTCRQFRQASRTFAVDDRPPAYRRISLHADGAVGSELIWVPDKETVHGHH